LGKGYSLLKIDFPPIPDLNHEHHQNCILNLVHDAMIADSHPVEVINSLQLYDSRRARVNRKIVYGIAQTPR
jgi:hypothetical protein